MARKYKTTIGSPAGAAQGVFQVTVERDRGRKPLVAHFGAIPLKRLYAQLSSPTNGRSWPAPGATS